MALHIWTFEHLKPTDSQMKNMEQSREAFKAFALKLDILLPDGPDKTYVVRQLRDCAMWANIAITRNPDGSPRT